MTLDEMYSINVPRRALHFAVAHHTGQKRDQPVFDSMPRTDYVSHPIRVAETVFRMVPWHPEIEEMFTAALLHDVVEDTPVTIQVIEERFGEDVAAFVYGLTDHFTKNNYPNLNRAERKSLEANRLAVAQDEIKLIKWADLQDNTSDITFTRPSFAPLYFREKANLIEMMDLHRVSERMNAFKQELESNNAPA